VTTFVVEVHRGVFTEVEARDFSVEGGALMFYDDEGFVRAYAPHAWYTVCGKGD
jgi:hypothetical protein